MDSFRDTRPTPTAQQQRDHDLVPAAAAAADHESRTGGPMHCLPVSTDARDGHFTQTQRERGRGSTETIPSMSMGSEVAAAASYRR